MEQPEKNSALNGIWKHDLYFVGTSTTRLIYRTSE